MTAVHLADVIVPATLPNLSIAPARIALAKLESRLVGELDAPFKLKDELAALNGQFANVVIDCPPALGLLTINALVASTHLLIPIQSSYFALEGTDDLLETIEKVRQRPNPELQILGVVITMHDKRTALARTSRSRFGRCLARKSSARSSARACGSRRVRPTGSQSLPLRRSLPAQPSTTVYVRR